MWMHLGKTLFLLLSQAQVHSKAPLLPYLLSPWVTHSLFGEAMGSASGEAAVCTQQFLSAASSFSLSLCSSVILLGLQGVSAPPWNTSFFSSSSDLGGISCAQ